MNLNDIEFLKVLAAAAAAYEQMTYNPAWRKAYQDINSGASLLWRLIEGSSVNSPKPE